MELELGHFGSWSMLTCGQGRGEMGRVRAGGYRTWDTGHLGRKTQDGNKYRKDHRHSLALTHHRHKKGRRKSFVSSYWLFYLDSYCWIITQSGVVDFVPPSWIKWVLLGSLGNIVLGDVCVRKFVLSFKQPIYKWTFRRQPMYHLRIIQINPSLQKSAFDSSGSYPPRYVWLRAIALPLLVS